MTEPPSVGWVIQDPNWNLAGQTSYELQVSHIMSALRSSGHEVNVLALRWGRAVVCVSPAGDSRLCSLVLTNRHPVRSVESVARRAQSLLRLPWMQFFDSLRVAEAAMRELASCDLMHERLSMYGFGGALASRQMSLPYVVSVDADYLLEHEYQHVRVPAVQKLVAVMTARYNYQAAHTIVCVSMATARYLVSKYSVPVEKVIVIPNGVDLASFSPEVNGQSVRRDLALDDDPVLVYVGGFYPWHAVDQVVDVFEMVRQRLPKARLLLVGDGATRCAVNNHVANKQLTRSTVFTGRVAHSEVPRFLAAADVAMALYPVIETEMWFSPMKLFEYMAAGKAIVASRSGQITSVLREGHNGRLVDPGDLVGAARAIVHLLEHPEQRSRLGRNARKQAEERHSWGHFADRLGCVYQRALSESSASAG